MVGWVGGADRDTRTGGELCAIHEHRVEVETRGMQQRCTHKATLANLGLGGGQLRRKIAFDIRAVRMKKRRRPGGKGSRRRDVILMRRGLWISLTGCCNDGDRARRARESARRLLATPMGDAGAEWSPMRCWKTVLVRREVMVMMVVS